MRTENWGKGLCTSDQSPTLSLYYFLFALSLWARDDVSESLQYLITQNSTTTTEEETARSYVAYYNKLSTCLKNRHHDAEEYKSK